MSSNRYASAGASSTVTAVPGPSNAPSQQGPPFGDFDPAIFSFSSSYTPTKQKLCGVQGVTYKREDGNVERANKEKHKLIGQSVVEEVKDAMVEVEGLIEICLPDTKTHFKPGDLLNLLSKRNGMYRKGKWMKFEKTKTSPSEPKVKKFLTDILKKANESMAKKKNGHQCLRHYSDVFHNKCVEDDVCDRKPDLVLPNASFSVEDIAKGRLPTWRGIDVTFEIKKNETDAPEALEQLAESARLIFKHQPNRRSVCGVVLAGDEMTFCVFDRSGVVNAPKFNIHDSPELFLRVVVGLACVDRKALGVDVTIYLEGPKKDWTVEVEGKKYPILNIVHTEGVIRGRGTACYEVKMDDGSSALVKDSWVDMSREEREIDTLERLKGIKHHQHVPKVHNEDAVVKFEGEDDTTATIRESLLRKVVKDGKETWEWIDDKHKDNELRRHERLLLTPFGRKIEDFRSLEELLNAIKHIALVIWDMQKIDSLHRDISLRNVLLQDLEGRFQGLLIDYDYAIKSTRAASNAVGHRTGTVPFMAIDVLKNAHKIPHAFYHDLESVFYVLCWICTTQGGPSNTNRRFVYEQTELPVWNGDGDKGNMRYVGSMKKTVMTDEDEFAERVTGKFDPYFEPIIECISSLRKLLFSGATTNASDVELYKKLLEGEPRNETTITGLMAKLPLWDQKPDLVFQSFITILEQSIAGLPEEHKVVPWKGTPCAGDSNISVPIVKAKKVAELKGWKRKHSELAVVPTPNAKSKTIGSSRARSSTAVSGFVAPPRRVSKRTFTKDETEVSSTGSSKRQRTSVGSRRSVRLNPQLFEEHPSDQTSSNTSEPPTTPGDGSSNSMFPVRVVESTSDVPPEDSSGKMFMD